MHILLTDALTCPRCGPAFGLILLADHLAERRVHEGSLGCANCREQYPVRARVAALRYPPSPQAAAAQPEPYVQAAHSPADAEEALRLAALLGVTSGPGTLLLAGPQARLAAALARAVPEVEVAALGAAAPADLGAAVSPLLAEPARWPLRDRSAAAVAVPAGWGDAGLAEAVRVLRGPGRLVVYDADAEAAAWLRARGLTVLLDAEGFVVASPARPG